MIIKASNSPYSRLLIASNNVMTFNMVPQDAPGNLQ